MGDDKYNDWTFQFRTDCQKKILAWVHGKLFRNIMQVFAMQKISSDNMQYHKCKEHVEDQGKVSEGVCSRYSHDSNFFLKLSSMSFVYIHLGDLLLPCEIKA